jgi:hypothetical protein
VAAADVSSWQIVLKNSMLGSVWVINQAADSEREEKHLAGRWLSGWDWD